MQGTHETELKASVSTALGADHDRLDGLFGEMCQAASDGRLREARAAFAEFRTGLERHIRIEEELVFPTFERLARMPAGGGPTAVMRHEHREIERLLTAVADKLAQAHDSSAEAAALQKVLGQHNVKEESVLYPMTDSLAGADGARELVRQMALG